ncbi:MAG: class I SAM-dependent methyltransferase, partial [Pseudomonadota bacterium]|nr:class I SAM-dependent methyltransferase [Pseudomonadota bacterium]
MVNIAGAGAVMVDRDTMAAYAANIDKYRNLVTKIGGNNRLDGFLARLAEGAAILDLGCGVGDSAVRMRDAGFAVSCTDASPDMDTRLSDASDATSVEPCRALLLDPLADAPAPPAWSPAAPHSPA